MSLPEIPPVGSAHATGYQVDATVEQSSPPSPLSGPFRQTSPSIPIPGSFYTMNDALPIAGPSSEGALTRSQPPSPLLSPSSAPAVPSVIAVAHPSLYIHTQHPRRGSMTPLGLHVISPVPPMPPASRRVGFNPAYNASFPSGDDARRGSTASTCSTLTQSRPPQSRRRSSLTPSIPNLAAPSPTRAHAAGRMHFEQPPMHARTRTAESTSTRSLINASPPRRGSLPHLAYGGWTPARAWNPVLPPPRSSLVEEGPSAEYKFGAVPSALPLRNLDTSRRSSAASRKFKDAFEEAEALEADKQRRAFLSATYGDDGRRARERLSLASGTPNSPGSAVTRRQSLMLWEKINTAATSGFSPIAPIVPTVEDIGPRRGSLPLAIPGAGLGRSPSRRREPLDLGPNIISPEGEEEEQEDDVQNTLAAPQRPLPPLLPLSDPGPRLLPSTLALHRANHLLNSRNLQADPLPHPLPPSLHPPAPVDLAEFDIDFILAGSQAQLGGQAAPAPTLKLGAEEEDTFAKFVGEFDDEYGGRRGEWTFRACPPRPPSQAPSAWDPAGNPVIPRAEWDSSGAGRYELYPNGDVRSIQTGSVWRIRRSAPREYELEEKKRGRSLTMTATPESPTSKPTILVGNESYVLSSKLAHNEHGGIKTATRQRTIIVSPDRLDTFAPPSARDRLGSADSAATARAPLSSSLPLVSTSRAPRKEQSHELPDRGRASISGPSGRGVSAAGANSRDRGEEEKKKSGGFGGAIKRAFKSTLAANEERKAAREEREREKVQSQSWSPSLTRSKDFIHPSGRNFAEKRGHVKTAPAAMVERSSNSGRSSRNNSDTGIYAGDSRPRMSPRGSSTGGDSDFPVLREGKAWKGVPDEAVAMIVPVDDDLMDSASRAPARQSLLVWFVPFNSETEDRPASSSSSRQSNDAPASVRTTESGSLPKFQKLLRRRASKDRALAVDRPSSVAHFGTSADQALSCAIHALPFRSFRVVARVVDTDELRPETGTSSSTSFSPFPPSRSTSGARAPSSLGSGPSPTQMNPSLPSTDENDVSSLSTAPTSTILAGRTFPTVIAVCHSRSQGVEFVLEGLDRLGFCQGDSAWGPTGYEEWRGSGLSENGRQLLDLLWAGCVGIMGLAGL